MPSEWEGGQKGRLASEVIAHSLPCSFLSHRRPGSLDPRVDSIWWEKVVHESHMQRSYEHFPTLTHYPLPTEEGVRLALTRGPGHPPWLCCFLLHTSGQVPLPSPGLTVPRVEHWGLTMDPIKGFRMMK